LDSSDMREGPPDFEHSYSTAGARRALAYEQRAVMELLGPLRPGVLLDVGTGMGRLINFPPPPEVVGTDPSERDLRSAQSRYAGDGSKHFVQAAVDSLPFRDDAFDAVISIRTIKSADDPESAVSEMADVTRPGGRLVLDVSNKFSAAAVLRRVQSWLRIRTPSGAYFSRADALRMVSSVGLTPFMTKPLFKVDPLLWRLARSERLVGVVERVERLLDGRTGAWFTSRYVAIACEKPFSGA